MLKVRSLTELCGVTAVKTYVAPKSLLQCQTCQHFGHTLRSCGYVARCVVCGEARLSGSCWTPNRQLKCCNCGGITRPTIDAVLNGKRRGWRLQSGRQLKVARGAVQLADLLLRRRLGPGLLLNRRIWALDGTALSEGAVVLRLLPHLIHNHPLGQSRKPLNRPK